MYLSRIAVDLSVVNIVPEYRFAKQPRETRIANGPPLA
jgi:hypothetical protein